MNVTIRRAVLPLLAIGLAGSLHAQTLTDLGSAAPSPGRNDIFQLSTSGSIAWPDGLNYFTDNDPPAGQTFTTGSTARKLVSVAIKTAGLNSGNGYGTPASTPTYYLRIYSVSGTSATLLNTFSAANPGFTDGDWLKWSGLNVALAANQTYAFSFGIKPSSGGWAALAVASGVNAGGEVALIPINGGTITTGGSHSFDAVFDLGLQLADIPASTPWPNPTYGMNVGNELELNWGPPNASLFTSAAQNGFNAVRIPCAWDMSGATTNISNGVTNYVISSSYMAQVKQTVDAAIAQGMYVMINDHWDDGWLQSNIGTTVDPIVNAKVKAYWTQIATTFAGYDNHLLFAACNEPSVASPAVMNTLMAYYQTFVNAVRAVGGNNTNRWLVLQGGGDTSWLNTLPTDTVSNRLMVEYHCYSPFQFTQLQGDASWGPMQYFWGPAYHYSGDASRDCGSPEEGGIDAGFQQLADQYVSKGIPVMIGEFQAAGKSSLTGTEQTWNNLSCYYWNKYVVDSAHAHGMSPFYWSTGGSPLDYGTGAVTDTNAVRVLTGGVAFPPPNGAPYAASGLTATASGNQVTLSWTAGSGATSYSLYRAAESGGESSIAPVATGITGMSYTDTGLNSGTTYYYQVVAVNGSGPTGFSPEAHAMTVGVNPDPAQFNFETDLQGWQGGGGIISGVATSTAQHYAGRQSLAVNFNGTASGSSSVSVGNVVVPAGANITFHIWIPSGSQITTVQPYLQDFNWTWTSSVYGSLTANAWNTITLTVPSTAVSAFHNLGIQFATSNAWSGTCYIDSVSWNTSGNTPPATPTGLSATAGTGQVALSWTAASGATGYNVKRATTSGGPYTTVANLSATGYTDTGLANGTTYYYVVSALNNGGESANSSQVSATTQVPPPATPTGLAATAGNAQATLNWTASSGATSYNVKRSTTSGSGYVTVTNVTGTSVVNLGLANGTTYYYVVSALNAGGESANSSQVSATPQVPSPAIPTGLAATAGNAQATLNWTASSGATSYNVKRSTTSGSGYVTVTNVTGTSVVNLGLVNGMTYYYVVSALNAGGESANSSQVSATPQVPPPATPTGLTATPNYSQVSLSWGSVSGAASYNVKRATTSGGPYTTLANVSTTAYNDTAVVNGTTYYYVVSALNAGGESANSSQVSAVPLTLPSPWSAKDIGAVGLAGSASYSNGVYTVAGSGSDTWGTADQFQYVYQTGGTNCSMTAKVLTVSNSNGSAKGGVMIRETLATNAVDCLMDIMASNGGENIWRTATGGSCSSVVVSGITPPYWVRVTRSGSKLIGYRSADGTTWTPVATNTITMANSVNIGLFVCSHNNSALCTATFTNVVASP